MNYRTHGHKHRLQIISAYGKTRTQAFIDLHCHACGTTFTVWRKPDLTYHIINTF